ncbi:MAG: hypothetical protein AB199_01415 [Parcubacteria bacterium C7867-004]|nr:MAG: hypothetical protein AB199_01415 [Parcubacteria bacterium C7867-004]
MEVMINYWAVLLSAIVCVILGAFWYGPLFGKQWMRLIDIKMPDVITPTIKKEMYKSYAITALSSIAMTFVLANILYFMSSVTRIGGVQAGLSAAIWTWVGFIVPATLISVTWEGKPWKYWFIIAGYYLVALSISGVILATWQ